MSRSFACRADAVQRAIRKTGLLGLIILLHIACFLVLRNALVVHQPVNVIPKEVIVSLITPEHTPEPRPSQAPKAVQAGRKSFAPAPMPVTRTSAPTAINTPSAPAEEPSLPAAPAAASPPGPPQPKQITSGIEYIEAPRPAYPAASKRMGEEGVVRFRVLVNTAGKAEKVDIIHSSGSSRLDEEVRRAVMRAVFKPHIENGETITVSADGVITFKLNR
ncbi:MAG TPA: TonB family protein [Herbaspirillum sp.]|nr:TonB family protein [Herbaspirillum sp.]